jgi:hypothetical protein
MKRLWKIAGIATLIAILGVVVAGAVAYADDEGTNGFPFDFGQRFKEAIDEILGISVEDYDAAVEQAQGQVVDEAEAEGWLTEEQAELFRWRMEQAPDGGMRGMMPRGFMGPHVGFMGRGGDSLLSVATDQLDMSLTDLLTELQAGKSIADVAGEQGVDPQAIVDAYVDDLAEDLNEAVADGDMTQTQADWQLEKAQERATEQIDATWEDGFRGGGRRGPMRGGFFGPGW